MLTHFILQETNEDKMTKGNFYKATVANSGLLESIQQPLFNFQGVLRLEVDSTKANIK